VLALQQLLRDDRGQSPEKVSLGVDDDNLRARSERVGVSLRSRTLSIAKPQATRGVASFARVARRAIKARASARVSAIVMCMAHVQRSSAYLVHGERSRASRKDGSTPGRRGVGVALCEHVIIRGLGAHMCPACTV
jgi:hypothetical protein